jgi:predicted phage terminase large subunit-like protein
VRYWDLASSLTDTAAYTAGVLLATDGERYFVEDVCRVHQAPADRNETILRTAKVDAERPGFERTWFEEQPGAAGVETSQALVRKLAGFPCRADRVTGSKQTRAEPFADAARGGLVRVVAGPWVAAYLAELEAFSRGTHKDQVDSSSGAFNKLAKGPASIAFLGERQ